MGSNKKVKQMVLAKIVYVDFKYCSGKENSHCILIRLTL